MRKVLFRLLTSTAPAADNSALAGRAGTAGFVQLNHRLIVDYPRDYVRQQLGLAAMRGVQ